MEYVSICQAGNNSLYNVAIVDWRTHASLTLDGWQTSIRDVKDVSVIYIQPTHLS